MHKYRFITISLLIAGLMGCGEGSSSEAKESETSSTLKAYNGLVQLTPGQVGTVDLAPYVDKKEMSTVLTQIKSKTSGCNEATLKPSGGLTFSTRVSGASLCEYEYTVEVRTGAVSQQKNDIRAMTPDQSASAIITVFGSTASSPALVPISSAIVLSGRASIKIDDELAALGGVYPIDYILSQDVIILGDGNVTVDSGLRTINYTANDDGPHRLVYKLQDPVGTNHRFGTIDIAVSNDANQGLFADDDALIPESIHSPVSKVEVGDVVEVDVKPFVHSADGGDYQLIQVNSMTATVTPLNPTDTTNKRFTFETNTAGDHYVSYVVADYYGAYDSGLMRFRTTQSAVWRGIQMGVNYFSAPLTYSEAVAAIANPSRWYSEGGYSPRIDVALFSHANAQTYCGTQGRLPTSAELSDLYSTASPSSPAHQWPVSQPYWANKAGTLTLVDLSSGVSSVPTSSSEGYVTCLNIGGLTLIPTKGVAVANGVDEAMVEVTYLLNGSPVEGKVLSADVGASSAILDSASETTDASGKALFKLTNIKAESVRLEVELLGYTVNRNVEFRGDASTARVSSLTVERNNAINNGTDSNYTTAVLMDANNNPVQGEIVTFTAGGSASLVGSPSTLKTDYSGEVTARFTNLLEETVQVSARYKSGAERSAVITFESYDFAGAYIDLFDVGSGKLFTNSPSVAYLGSIGLNFGLGYLSYLETGRNGPFGGFSIFNWTRANAVCNTYNTNSLGGRTNWRLPTIEEVADLYASFGNLHPARGWSTSIIYWSATPDGSSYYGMNLRTGAVISPSPTMELYGSCVSNP
ncbi:Ig-like domain-containing protein [Vibrio crassostreae]|uniref:Ig-like domain-containing protein n=1 Tax=Vibrio crassostreae TaxID=246167 RepID=UPI00104310B1|nr:Ig-like domain-containing protein [Vibrio crassostreae]TCW20765.1 Ig-like protein group 1 [Vibrio crassostreae]